MFSPFSSPHRVPDVAETALASIWSELLRTGPIEPSDNFYRLGGDSLLAITMIHRARERGFALTMQQVVASADLRELAAQAAALDLRAADEPAILPVGRPFGLTPIQCWFFEQDFAAPRAISQCQIVTAPEFDDGRLEAALRQVLAKHDAFRLCFPAIEGKRRQVYAESAPAVALARASVEGLPDPDRALGEIVAEWLRDLDFEHGRTLVAGVVRGHPDGRARLFIGIHHLICDGVSWRVLLEDLRSSYFFGHAGSGSCGTPLHAWRDALEAYAHDRRTVSQLEHWRAAKTACRELRSALGGCESRRTRKIDCSTALEDVLPLPAISGLQEHRMEILLTAFLLAVREELSVDRVPIQLEGHGRETCAGVAPGHGVGWYTSLFPAVFELPGDGDAAAAYRAVKDHYRRIPDRGLGYGALRYLHSDSAVRDALAGEDSPVLFNYLGSFNNHDENGWRLYDDESGQDVIAPVNRRDALLEVNCSIVDERFICRIDCAADPLSERRVRRLGQRFLHFARRLCTALLEEAHSPASSVARTFPLTPLQEGMLFHDRIAPDAGSYFVQMIWRYRSVPDAERIRAAWTTVTSETEALRTFFRWDPHGRPMQSVVERVTPEVVWSDISDLDALAQEEWIEDWLRRDRSRGFDLSTPGLFRVHYIRRGSDCCELVLSNHHIILDGWSVPLVLNRVHRLYLDPDDRRDPSPAAGLAELVAYVNGQDAVAARRDFEMRAAGTEWSIDVPIRRPGAVLDPHKAAAHWRELYLQWSVEETHAIASLQRVAGITPNTLLMFSLGTVLSAYGEGRPTLFGTTLSGRNHDLAGLDSLVGLTINTLPLLFHPRAERDVRAALADMQVQIARVTELSACPLRSLDECGQSRFNVLAVFENYPEQDGVGSGELRAELVREIESTGYPVTIVFRVLGGRLQTKVLYDEEAFSEGSIDRMARHIRNVALQAAASPDRPCAELHLVDDEEAAALQGMLRGPEPANGEQRIDEVFARQAALQPDRVALRHGDRSFTYEALGSIAASLRDEMLAAAIAPGSLVAVVAERSPELVYGMLAILEARCTYLPIDPGSPPERNRRILEDAGVEHILGFSAAAEELAGSDLIESSVGKHGRLLRRRLAAHSRPVRDPDVAYVMYTSGSTGMPKGAMVRHASVLRLVLQPNYAVLDESSRVLHTSAPGFDASIFEIWGTLLNGGTLVQMPGNTVLDPFEVERVLRDERINVLFLTTALFHRWENAAMFAPVEQLLVGGEVLSPEIAERVRCANPHLRLSNMYGPTENGTFSTFEPLVAPLEGRPVPIGRPVNGTYCLVLDEHLRLVPQGVAGELYVGGVGLATGYLHQPEVTARKFIELPAHLRIPGQVEGERMYRTGDRVRILDGGSLEFLGRVDDQVKIRGHRVEPGEVEWHLRQHPRVRDGAVVYVPPAKDRHYEAGRLAACYVPADAEMEREGPALIESFLRGRVPAAMIPQRYLRLERIPLNANGKVDRGALRTLASQWRDDADGRVAGNPSTSAAERVVMDAWERCLNRGPIDPELSLHAVGGDSLTAVQICTELSRRGYRLAVADLLRCPTVRDCSRHVVAAAPDSVAAVAPSADYPLGPAQSRFLRRDLQKPHHFVIPLLLRLKRAVTADEVSSALQAALADQDSHRVQFHRHATTGAVRQVFRDWSPTDYFERVDLHRDRVAAHAAAVCSSLDIWNGPLFRATLFEGCEGGSAPLLHLVFHHLICDGVSMSLLLQRLRMQLAAPDVRPAGHRATNSYLQWCREMERYCLERGADRMRRFWEPLLSRGSRHPEPRETAKDLKVETFSHFEILRRASPTQDDDLCRPSHREMRTQTTVLLEGEEQLEAFADAAADLRSRPFTVLLGMLASLLHDRGLAPRTLHVQTSQREYGGPLSGTALHETMGYFSAALPFALPPARQCAALEPDLFRAIERHMAEVLEHGRDYLALRYVLPELDPRARPLKDPSSVMFHYLGDDPLQEANDVFEPADIPAGPSTDPDHPSNYLLNITVTRGRGALQATFYYSPAHYRRHDVEAVCSAMRSRLRELCGVGVPA